MRCDDREQPLVAIKGTNRLSSSDIKVVGNNNRGA
jgi:hypothetical protein